MSGSSLDGIDLAFATIQANYEYDWLSSAFFPYDESLREQLASSHDLAASDLFALDVQVGAFFADKIARFLSKCDQKADLICLHGHTVFHQPQNGFSLQIGQAEVVSARLGLPVISDLRNADIAYGGQGAPIVPIAEKHLMKEHNCFLNIGGIANLSVHTDDQVFAWDVCAANQALNYLASLEDHAYDHNGELAAQGQVDQLLLTQLNDIAYFDQQPPKSLDNAFFREQIRPVLMNSKLPIVDQLATLCRHIAMQIDRSLDQYLCKKMLVTGGGAKNQFLMAEIAAISGIEICIPEERLVDYKEALAMAFFGALRWWNRPNCLASVTGASQDSCGGRICI